MDLEIYCGDCGWSGTDAFLNYEGDDEGFSLMKLIFRPPFRFFEMYVIKKGFLDGLPGFIIAVASSFYVFFKYAKLWELTKHKEEEHLNKTHD